MSGKLASVVLIDDQVLFVESLKNVIQSRATDFDVVGVYYSAETAIDEIGELRPDLVLLDVRMPGIDGVEAANRIRTNCADTKILILTTYYEDEYVTKAVANGAAGYLLKDMPPEVLISNMRSALSGQLLIPSKFAGRIADLSILGDENDLPAWFYELSRKERTILRLVIEGFENEEIAERVYLAPQTVKNYISRMYSKSETDSRSHLIKSSRRFLHYL